MTKFTFHQYRSTEEANHSDKEATTRVEAMNSKILFAILTLGITHELHIVAATPMEFRGKTIKSS